MPTTTGDCHFRHLVAWLVPVRTQSQAPVSRFNVSSPITGGGHITLQTPPYPKEMCFHCIGIKGQFRAREFSKVEDPSERPTHFQQQLGRVPLRTQSQSQVSRFVFPHRSLQCLSGKHYSACRSSKTIVFLTTVPDICSLVRRTHF